MNWVNEIARMLYVKQALSQADTIGLWPHHLPSAAASDDEIVKVERHLGFALPHKYVTFLRHANGWRGFYQAVDLFGTPQFLGDGLMTYARELLEYIEPTVFSASGLAPDDVLPIAVTKMDRDLFVLAKQETVCPGAIIWYAGTEIQRFSDFDDFFLAMVDYNLRQIELCNPAP